MASEKKKKKNYPSMAGKSENKINLKAMVDKRSNKVIFIESDSDFVDVLFSFLTVPMGTIIKHGRNHPAPVGIGCIKNLYSSVENIHLPHFGAEGYRSMLLCPYNGAHSHCKDLKLKVDDSEPTRYFMCSNRSCRSVSHYKGVLCECKKPMDREMSLSVKNSEVSSTAAEYGGVFLKGLIRFLVTDDLHVMPPLSSEISTFFTKMGVLDLDENAIEEKIFSVGVDKILKLLMCSLVSKTPLTDTLLKDEPEKKVINENHQGISTQPQMEGDTVNEEKTISVKLMVSKSKKLVCYAEAGDDFVNLLFSFLTFPLGFVVKQSRNSSCNGCINQLCSSIEELDEQYLKSNSNKEILLCPKLYPGFCYKNPFLGIEYGPVPTYFYAVPRYYDTEMLASDENFIHSYSGSHNIVPLKLKYSKSKHDGGSGEGFLNGHALFTVTDNLMIRPMSPIFTFSLLKELKLSFIDLEEKVVQVGKEEVLRLLVASFLCDSALTNVFL